VLISEVDEVLERTQQLTSEQRKIVTAFLKRDLGEELTPDDKQALIGYYAQLRTQRALSVQERQTAAAYLLELAKIRSLANAERYLLLEVSMIDTLELPTDFSDRREDWYGDDGR